MKVCGSTKITTLIDKSCLGDRISFLTYGAQRMAEIGSEIAEIAIHLILFIDTKLCEVIKANLV
jgi:hypothetical protein